MKKLLTLFVVLLFVYSCKKDTKTPEPTPVPVADVGTVKVTFKNMVDTLPLVFGNTYRNPNGDTMSINMFKYYISNVVFTKSDGSKHVEPNSYHLINQGLSSSLSFVVSNIPAGTYTSVTYMIGVDSIRNVSGAQDGDLMQSLNMFWDWSTGYIMLKLEGFSPQSASLDKSITFHLGGFSDPYNVLKTRTITFGQNLIVSKNNSPQLKLKTNVNEIFKTPTTVSFAASNEVTAPGINANSIANNYADMISYETIVP
jgi:hypothetical protein